jgi:hypothetical protein
MDELSTQQVAKGIRLALEANHSLLNEEISAELMKILAAISSDDGKRALSKGAKPE